MSECVAHIGLSQGRVSTHLGCLAADNAAALAACMRIGPGAEPDVAPHNDADVDL